VAGFFSSGHAVDLVLLVLLVEGLILWRRGKARPLSILFALLPAAFLLLAARNALVGGPWHITALLLALSFPAHLADLARRGW
jgi:hypothetical protein